MERNEERVRRANEKGFEMITIRASSREDAKKRERAKTTTKELLFGKKRMKMKKGARATRARKRKRRRKKRRT